MSETIVCVDCQRVVCVTCDPIQCQHDPDRCWDCCAQNCEAVA